eukprot:CAMPEP_0172483564 /NCGR_PEP_ID=MMETSP1066-20121228/10549_1 /TAXON_ID=671091 /ORGANISM="Coscinodiscus wailesii, Strain CCMP2513" /LENGTH=344 /DNA_ID=CAMNT_0013247481 /DNA_START=1 /DNA_END=1035 /DNA_ORIENTATION=-
MEVVRPVIAETFRTPMPPPPKLKLNNTSRGNGNNHKEVLMKSINRDKQSGSSNNNTSITFFTARSVFGDHFFQSFLACVPRHAIIDVALRLTSLYYKGKLDWYEADSMMVGPHILWRAYQIVTGVDPTWIGKDYLEERLFEDKNTTDEQDRVYYSTRILQEDHYDENLMPDTSRRDKNMKSGSQACLNIVHDYLNKDIDLSNSTEQVTGYFYARIVGSSNCFPKHYEFCGDGAVGNGICLDINACCSKYGWCGYGNEFCSQSGLKVAAAKFSFCGGGSVGNGICADRNECCSKYGWCDKIHCEINADIGFCGKGDVANGTCQEDGLCCSRFGWCGTGEQFCDDG